MTTMTAGSNTESTTMSANYTTQSLDETTDSTLGSTSSDSSTWSTTTETPTTTVFTPSVKNLKYQPYLSCHVSRYVVLVPTLLDSVIR